MKILIQDLINDTEEVLSGDREDIETRLRFRFPSVTDSIAEGHLDEVIHAIARIQRIHLVITEFTDREGFSPVEIAEASMEFDPDHYEDPWMREADRPDGHTIQFRPYTPATGIYDEDDGEDEPE